MHALQDAVGHCQTSIWEIRLSHPFCISKACCAVLLAIRENSSPFTLVARPLAGVAAFLRRPALVVSHLVVLFGGASNSWVCSRFGRQACTTRPVDDGDRDVIAMMMMQHVCKLSMVESEHGKERTIFDFNVHKPTQRPRRYPNAGIGTRSCHHPVENSNDTRISARAIRTHWPKNTPQPDDTSCCCCCCGAWSDCRALFLSVTYM